MSSTVSQRDDSFVQLNYEGLLATILKELQTKPPIFTPVERDSVSSLVADVDKIAYTVARQSDRFEDPLGNQAKVARVATVHFGDSEERFNAQIKQIYEQLQSDLEFKLQESGQTLRDFVGRLQAPLRSFTGNPTSLGLSYPFSSHKNLTKQRLTLGETGNVKPILRFHKLTVTVHETNKFRGQVGQALRNYSEQEFGDEANEDDLDALNDILDALEQNTTSNIHDLLHVVNTESLGKIKREAQICYLEFLRDNLVREVRGKGMVYLEDLIRRLRLIERYLGDAEAVGSDFRVSFDGGMPVDYRDLFTQSHVFNQLPIIPVIEGSLGESKDEEKGTRTFVFGLKMKLNGKVQNQEHVKSPDAFDYYLQLLDPNSALYQTRLKNKGENFQRRILQLILLYFFTFNRFGDSSYSDEKIISDFKTHILPKFQASDVQAQYKVLAQIRHNLNQPGVRTGLKELEAWLRHSIKNNNFQERPYPFHILIKRSLLERDLDTVLQQRTFFRSLFNSKNKEVLRHIAISKPRVDSSALCKLTAEITISNLHYFPTRDSQQFSMSYHVDDYQTLPVLMVPKEQPEEYREKLRAAWSKYPHLLFPYRPSYLDLDEVRPYPKHAYVYRFTFSLLSYLSLKLLLAHAPEPEQLFVPIVRLHLGTKDDKADQDGFIRSLSKVMAHLLSTECISNAQGFYMPEQLSDDQNRIWKLRNGLSSLYSVLPKRFKFTSPSPVSELDKLALVIVSRRESDSKWRTSPSDKLSCLMGEVVSVERVDARTIQSKLLHTFTDNYHISKMDTHPTALIDEVGRLYQDGYRHFIYIAKSPYTSTLHLTEQPDEDNLFFMSRKVIQALKENRPDLKLYPVFFDTYSVVKLPAYPNASTPQSLFIQETRELQRIMEDSSKSKQVVIFYNLFNGIEVGRRGSDDHYYNGVISYATLLGMYEDILEDADILRGLLLDENNPLKSDILNYLTLFHFSRYEAAGTQKQPISLKLNPYENLIGDQSVGKLAMWAHAAGYGEWNALAFLAKVRKVLNQ